MIADKPDSMIGVCIGVGEKWNKAAWSTAHRMSMMTGLQCKVIDKMADGLAHPSWMKGHILGMFPEHDSFLVFDADILPLKPWRPKDIFENTGRAFCAVPDRNWAYTQRECTNFNLPWPDVYVNGGLLMFGQEHAGIWESVMRKHPKYGSWLEQTALNEALIKSGIEVCRLPRRFNQLYSGSNPASRARAINLHLTESQPDYIVSALERLNHGSAIEPSTQEKDQPGDENRLDPQPAETIGVR